MTNGNVAAMETVTVSDRIDVYRVKKLPKATLRWPIPSSPPPPLPEQLVVYQVTQVPGRELTTAH